MKLYIPQQVKVGYQERSGTYTGKLAYVIYYDDRGRLRKERSWESWRHTDIEPNEFANEPTEGFVLNKKAGGYSSGWNHRATYCRVYDPRGFEFEIDIPNLLYILENTNSIKGKGLEGEFVYGWAGTELVLVPTSAPDFELWKGVSDKLSDFVQLKGKDLIEGATYVDRDNKKLVFLTKAPRYQTSDWERRDTVEGFKYPGNYYYFMGLDNEGITCLKSLTRKIIQCVDETPIVDYAYRMDKLEGHKQYCPVMSEKTEYIPLTVEELENYDKRGFGYLYPRLWININGRWDDMYVHVSTRAGKRTYELSRGPRLTAEEFVNRYKPAKRVRYLRNGKRLENDK